MFLDRIKFKTFRGHANVLKRLKRLKKVVFFGLVVRCFGLTMEVRFQMLWMIRIPGWLGGGGDIQVHEGA